MDYTINFITIQEIFDKVFNKYGFNIDLCMVDFELNYSKTLVKNDFYEVKVIAYYHFNSQVMFFDLILSLVKEDKELAKELCTLYTDDIIKNFGNSKLNLSDNLSKELMYILRNF